MKTNRQLTKLLQNTLEIAKLAGDYEKVKGVANYDLESNSVSLNIYAINKEEKVRLIDLRKDNAVLSSKWSDLSIDYIMFGLDNFNKYPDQMFFEIDCITGHFNIDFKQDIFHEDYSSLNESALFDYHITGKVPNNDFMRKELNKALIFHDEKTV